MAGLSKDAPSPTEIKLHQTSGVLEIALFDGGSEIQPHDPILGVGSGQRPAGMLGNAKVVAAGFLSLVTNTQGRMSVNCYGRSQSLDVGSRPEDSRLAAKALHLDV